MHAAVTDPALAAILQRRRLLSEPALAEVAAHCSEEEGLKQEVLVAHGPRSMIRPGIVQEALAAIQEKPLAEVKAEPAVQCFDMATDSESEEESCVSDVALDTRAMPVQSSESTWADDEEVESCGERSRPQRMIESWQDSLLPSELRASEILPALSEQTSAADLKLALQQRLAAKDPALLTLLVPDGTVYVPLGDDSVLGAVCADVEELVVRGQVFLLCGAAAGVPRPSALEAENAELRAKISELEERLAIAEGRGKQEECVLAGSSGSAAPEAPAAQLPGNSWAEAAQEAPRAAAAEEAVENVAEEEEKEEPPPAAREAEVTEAVECQRPPEEVVRSPAAAVQEEPQATEVSPLAAEVQNAMPKQTARQGTAPTLTVMLLSMQSPDQPAMKVEMTLRSTIADLRAAVTEAFRIDERTARRLRFLRKRGACYVSFTEAERVREKIFLHDPDIRALSGPQLCATADVGAGPVKSMETPVGLDHHLPKGLDDNIRSFIFHTFAQMSSSERAAWNALPKFVIWTMWFDIISSPLFQKCGDPLFRKKVFGSNFERKAPIQLAKDDAVLKEYAFHKRQLISVWFQDDEPTQAKAASQAPAPPAALVRPVLQQDSADDNGLFDFDLLEELELARPAPTRR